MALSLTDQRAADTTIPVTDGTELGRVLDAIVERGRALVGARAMVVLILEGNELAVVATAGELDAEVDGLRFPSASRVRQVLDGHRASGRAATEDASALVAPLEFTMAEADYLALGGHAAAIRRLDDILSAGGEYTTGSRVVPAR